jgi:hypothetical protein
MKTCKKCKIVYPIENFTSNKQNADNRQTSCRMCMAAYKKIQRSTPDQKEKNKLYGIRNKYKLTADEYYKMIARGCDSCGSHIGIAIDHDHSCCPKTKTCGNCIRGVLCRRCNTAEGIFKTNPQSIYGLIKYMEKHGIIK